MRKYFSHLPAFLIIFLLIFSVTGLVFPQTARATPYEDCRKDPDKTLEECELLLGAPPSPEQEAVDKSLSWGGWVLDKTVKPAVAWIATTILQLVSLLTALGGVILNGVIYLTIVKVADNYSNLTSINSTWSVVRDLANMGFIFVLLYASINTILGRGEDNKKLIVKIIIAAILINFSLFFTKIVIDISNILALLFYDAMVPSGSLSNFNIAQTGLSNAFMQRLNLTNLYHITQGATISIEGIITIGVMGSIMLLIAAFVFFAVAIMLVIRYVILILVLILSPIAFVSSILPGLSDKGKQWWNALSGQAFFAPVYFMLTWITLNMLDGVMNQTVGTLGVTSTISTSSLASIALDPSGNLSQQGAIPMFINFIIVIIFLIASLIIAKEWANKAGPSAAGLTKWAMGAAGGATLGGAALAARHTFSRAGAVLGESERLKERAAKGGAGGMIARLALATGRKTGGASFDFRATKVGGATIGTVGAGTAGGKGGFAEFKKKQAELEEKKARSYGPSNETLDQAEQAVGRAKTDEERKTAQTRLDQLKGVDKKRADEKREEVKRRKEREIERDPVIKKVRELEEEIKRKEAEGQGAAVESIRRALDVARKESEARMAEMDKRYGAESDSIREIPSMAQRRKETYAQVVENSYWAKMRGYNRAAAAQIRRGKSKKEKFAEAAAALAKEEAEASGEVEKPEEEKPKTPPTSPAGGTSPTS